MNLRFLLGPTRAPHEVQAGDGQALPRVGDTVVLPAGATDSYRGVVKSVVWDYCGPGAPVVEVQLSAAAPARVPSYAVYTD